MPYNPNIKHVYGEVSIDGGGGATNVNVVNKPTVNVENTATPIDVNITNSPLDATVSNTVDVAVTNTPTVNVGTMPTASVTQPTINYDSAGRTRVSIITTLLDGKILNADNTRLFQNVGTGTGSFSDNLYTMSVTAGQYLIRQSRRFCPYFSGKSQIIEETFDNFQPQAGVTKRVGYFSSNAVAPYDSNKDGFWLESDGTTIRLVLSKYGTIVHNQPITSWTGYADLAEYQNLATWQNFTVAVDDFLWLGGATLQLHIKTSNGFVLAHKFDYAGTAQGQFFLSPNQPIRYEIRSTGGSGTLRYVCCQVGTEGSFTEAGETMSITNVASITANTVGTVYALLGVKKNATYRDIAIQIIDMAISNTSPNQDAGVLYLLLNPTLSAPLSYVANSRVDAALATTQTVTLSGGLPVCDRIIAALPVGAAGSTTVMAQNFLSYLTGTITNTFDEYVLAYLATTINQTVNGVLTIKEY